MKASCLLIGLKKKGLGFNRTGSWNALERGVGTCWNEVFIFYFNISLLMLYKLYTWRECCRASFFVSDIRIYGTFRFLQGKCNKNRTLYNPLKTHDICSPLFGIAMTGLKTPVVNVRFKAAWDIGCICATVPLVLWRRKVAHSLSREYSGNDKSTFTNIFFKSCPRRGK